MFRHVRIKTLYKRILITYLPIVTAILLGATSAIVLVTGRYVSNEMDGLRQTMLYTAADVMDEKVKNLYDSIYQLAVNSSITSYKNIDSENPDYQNIITIKNVGNVLESEVANNDLVREAFLYQFESDVVFSSQYRGKGLYNPVDGEWTFFSDFFKGITRDEVCDILATIKHREFRLLPNEEDWTLLLVTPIPMISDKPDMVLAFVINLDEFSQFTTVSLTENEDMFVVNDNNQILFSVNGINSGLSLLESGIDENSQKEYIIYNKESVHSGISYFYLTDPTFIQRHANVIALYSLMIGGCALLIISIFIILFSKKLYKPIQSILGILPEDGTITKASTDMEIIQKSISGMRFKDEQRSSYIQSFRSYVAEQVLFKILKKKISPQKASKMMEKMPTFFAKDRVMVSIVRISYYAAMSRQISEATAANIVELISADAVSALLDANLYVVSDGNTLYIIVNYDINSEINENWIENRLKTLQEKAAEKYSISTRIVMGITPDVSVNSNIETLMHALQESVVTAEETMKQLFFFENDKKVYKSSKQKITPVNFYRFPPDKEQAISNYLFAGRGEEAIALASAVIKENMENSNYHYENIRQVITNLLSVAIQTILDSNTLLENVLKPRYQLYIGCEECESLNEAQNYIYDIYRTVAEYFGTGDGRWPVKRKSILAYIDDNLYRDFGIAEIADHFNLSKGYYCKIFREMTGLTTLEYINQRRIERSVALIRSGEYSLKEISDKVGISNYKTFIRLYKKYMHCTPGEYKRKMVN